MNAADPNVALLELAVRHLSPLLDRFVLIGGCATGLLITDKAAPPVRATTDVDLLVEVMSLISYYELSAELRSLGFAEDRELTCRWRLEGLIVDVMPTDVKVLGTGNRWYPHVVRHAAQAHLPSGASIQLISPPVFIATKLEAFYGRGEGDYGSSRDMEDIIAIVDGRPELVDEMSLCDPEVRQFIIDEFDDLLADSTFVSSVAWHFRADEASQGRVPIVLGRLRSLAGM
jgi:predicted nucleotidyltransferase